MPGRTGFTLSELLVVIGILCALIGVLLPALASSRRAAQKVACAANLRQWAMAANQYAIDNQNFLPRRGQGQLPTTEVNRPEDWFNALPPALNQARYIDMTPAQRLVSAQSHTIWSCPSASARLSVSGNVFAYGMNMRLSTWLNATPSKIDQVGSMSTMVFMADAPGAYCSVLPFAGPFSPTARHNGQVNIAFLDGHVASFDAAYVGCNKGDPLQPDVRWVVPGDPWSGPTQ